MKQLTPDPDGLSGAICVVTGAGSGIGRGCALALAGAGARLLLLDIHQEGLATTAESIGAAGGHSLIERCDTSDPDQVAAAAQRCERELGPCAVLVNAAGILRPGGLGELPLALWNQVMSVNLTAYFICAQAFGRQMRQHKRGALVHIASIAADHATPYGGAYSVAKAGVAMLSRQLALEWAPHGIRSNTVNPGLTETGMTAPFHTDPQIVRRRSGAIPLGRIGQPQDIAQAVLFLASNRAQYITGQDLTVDGGFARSVMATIPRPGYESP
jgi:NAD(P)-dependent dehydrogenase (short-subunit alcohol dehydrogenase family)